MKNAKCFGIFGSVAAAAMFVAAGFSQPAHALGWQKLAASGCGTDSTYFNGVAIPSPTAIYVVGGGPIIGGPGIICKSTDGGNSFSELDIPTTEAMYAIDCVNSMTCFAAGGGGKILKTSTGGASWSMVTLSDSRDILPGPDPNPTFGGIKVVSPYAGITVVAVGNYGNIWRTTNGGTSWGILNFPNIPEDFLTVLTDVHFANTTTGYITGYDRTLIKSTDGGANWSVIESLPDDLFGSNDAVQARTPTEVRVTGDVDLFRSNDGALSWLPRVIISSDGWLNIPFSDSFFTSDSIGFAVGGAGGGIIRKSIDGGASFPNFFPGLTDPASLSSAEQEILEDISVRDSAGTLIGPSHLKNIECYSPGFCMIVGEDHTILRRDMSYPDLVPGDGWSLACSNTGPYLHIIAGMRNLGDGVARAPFQVKLQGIDADANPIPGAEMVVDVAADFPPAEFRVVDTLSSGLSPVELYNLFHAGGGPDLTIRMTVDSNITAERPNGDVVENPEGGEANNVREQTTPCGVAAAPATGGGGPQPGPKKKCYKDKKGKLVCKKAVKKKKK